MLYKKKLKYHFRYIIWASFDFRPCKKKIEKHPCNFFIWKMSLDPHFWWSKPSFGSLKVHVAISHVQGSIKRTKNSLNNCSVSQFRPKH